MEIVSKIAPIALALIMLGLGLGLSIKDFTRILRNPKDFLVGFICQLILFSNPDVYIHDVVSLFY